MYLKYDAVGESTDIEVNIPRTKYTDEDFTIYEMFTDERSFIPYKLNKESKLKLYNSLTAYSKLKGMKYWNRGEKVAMEFIVDAYRIQSPDDNKKIPDPVYNEIQPKITNYFIQEDNKFGKSVYRSELINDGDNFILNNTCLTPISKFLVTLAKTEESKNYTIFIYDKEKEGYYYYTLNVMRIRNERLLKSKKLYPGTFSNRLRGSTIHLVSMLGIDWSDKIKPWKEGRLRKGRYRNY